MYKDQLKATTPEARKAILTQMQNLIYDNAAYDILYYDANLEAYRTDRFAGWTKQPEANGTPFFTYSTLAYTKLTDAAAAPSPAPSEAAVASSGPSSAPGASGAAAPVPSPAPSGGDGSNASSSSTPVLLGLVALVVVVGVGLFLFRRRGAAAGGEDDE
jgi:peptide/nickel transport system substrate-binding protein